MGFRFGEKFDAFPLFLNKRICIGWEFVMIYTVTLNPALDYVVQVDALKIGELNRSREERIYPGGKGINVSVVLKNLGHDSVTLGFVAGFTGNQLIKELQQREIRSDFISVESGYVPFSNSSILPLRSSNGIFIKPSMCP